MKEDEKIRTEHAPVAKEAEHAFELVTEGGSFLKFDDGTISTNDFVGR